MFRTLDNMLKNRDAVILTSPHNMRYFSGFSGGEGAVVVSKNARVVYTDSRYVEQAEDEAPDFSVVETNDWKKTFGEHAIDSNLSTVVIEEDCVSVAEYERLKNEASGVEFIFGATDIKKLRMVKTGEEIARIKEAEEIGCKAFEHILGYLKPGVSERDIALEIEYFMRKNGAEGISFDTIAISGARTSLPHGVPTDKKIEKGDFVTLDFGCVYKGYCSDMTRTVVVGKANSEQKKVYDVVKEAQQRGLDAICEGVRGCDVDNVARDYIKTQGYGEFFRHSLGHGVGLQVHELPNLSPKSEIELMENMVVSCEPGIYIPGFGGVRIEDLVRVTRNGCENLVRVTKELIEL